MSLQFQYYDTVAHGYTGILTVTGGLMMTDGSGVPSFAVSIPNALTWTNTQTYNFNAASLPGLAYTGFTAGHLALHIGGKDSDNATVGYGSVQIVMDSFTGTGAAGGNYGQIVMRHAGGTAAAPSATPSGDALFQLWGGGYGATGWKEIASAFQSKASETWTDTKQGCYWQCFATTIGTSTLVEVARFSPDSGGFIRGTNTNDNAAAGNIGEYVTSGVIDVGNLTTATAKSVTSISLTAGDWDVEGCIQFTAAAGTVATYLLVGMGTVTNTIPPFGLGYNDSNISYPAGAQQTMPTGRRRFSLSTTTTVYLIGYAQFTVSTLDATGEIAARRVR